MTDQDYRNIIARDWMEKSESALKAAEILLGENMLVACVNRLYYAAFYAPSAALVDSLSSQKWVTPQTPPTFIAHGSADNSVPIQNSIMFDSACAANGVPHKFMIDQGKGHGYGLAGTWPDTLLGWMRERGFISSTSNGERRRNEQRAAAIFQYK